MPSFFRKRDGRPKKNVTRLAAPPNALKHAIENRKRQNVSEAVLWLILKDLRINGTPVRRQARILWWIADFYHPGSRTVIEVDGGYHSTPEQRSRDAHRDKTMREFGFNVIRFSAEVVLDNPAIVVQQIIQAIPIREKARELGAHGRRAGSREVTPAMEATKSRAS